MFLCCCCFLFLFLLITKKEFNLWLNAFTKSGFRTPGCQWDNLSLGFLELLNWMYLVMLEGSPRREENKLQAVVLTWSTLLEWIRQQVIEFKLNITESIIHFASRDKEIMLSLFKSSNCLVNGPCTWMCRWWADGAISRSIGMWVNMLSSFAFREAHETSGQTMYFMCKNPLACVLGLRLTRTQDELVALYSASNQGLWFSYGMWKIPCPTAEPATKLVNSWFPRIMDGKSCSYEYLI